MISVSLEVVLRVPDATNLWPQEFRELFESIKKARDDRTIWLAMADWLDENDEPGLARAFRYIGKRTEVLIAESTDSTVRLAKLPSSVSALMPYSSPSWAALMANLAIALRKHDEEAA